jgi:hypothetical protein
MALNTPIDSGQVTLKGLPIKRVDDFKYLGSMMKSTQTDFDKRKGLAHGAWANLKKLWNAEHIPLYIKLNVFEASVISILIYGCESWIISEQLESKINSFATNCYRHLLGIKRADHITNESIYKAVDKSPLIQTIRKRQLGWVGHSLRRPSADEPAKIFAIYEPPPDLSKKTKQGRPKLTYRTQIAKLLTSTPELLTNVEIEKMAMNEKEWKKRVYGQDKLPNPK